MFYFHIIAHFKKYEFMTLVAITRQIRMVSFAITFLALIKIHWDPTYWCTTILRSVESSKLVFLITSKWRSIIDRGTIIYLLCAVKQSNTLFFTGGKICVICINGRLFLLIGNHLCAVLFHSQRSCFKDNRISIRIMYSRMLIVKND